MEVVFTFYEYFDNSSILTYFYLLQKGLNVSVEPRLEPEAHPEDVKNGIINLIIRNCTPFMIIPSRKFGQKEYKANLTIVLHVVNRKINFRAPTLFRNYS